MLIIAVGALGYELKPPPQSGPGEPPVPRGTPINRFSPNEQQRVARILAHLRWEPKHNKSERWWERGKEASAQDARSPAQDGSSQHPSQSAQETLKRGGIPSQLTNWMKEELRKRDYSEEFIRKVKPEEAWEILNDSS
jgi:hypothetical protein